MTFISGNGRNMRLYLEHAQMHTNKYSIALRFQTDGSKNKNEICRCNTEPMGTILDRFYKLFIHA